MFERWNTTVGMPALVLFSLLIGMTMTYQAARKGELAPIREVSALSAQAEPQPLPMGRFYLGEIIAPSRDEELHHIKFEIEIGYQGDLAKVLEERKLEIKEKISQNIAKMTVARVKEDYPDGFLQANFRNDLNTLLKTSTSQGRIPQIIISSFLIN